MHKINKKSDTTHALHHFALLLKSHCKGNTLIHDVLPEAIHPWTHPCVKVCKSPNLPLCHCQLAVEHTTIFMIN